MQPDTPPVGQPVAIHPLQAQDARKAEVTTALPLHRHTSRTAQGPESILAFDPLAHSQSHLVTAVSASLSSSP